MVWRCPPVLHLRPSTLIDQFGHVECHHLLPGPAHPFLCERQSLAGRWLFKPCQIRRVMMRNMPTTFVCSTPTITATKQPAHFIHALFPFFFFQSSLITEASCKKKRKKKILISFSRRLPVFRTPSFPSFVENKAAYLFPLCPHQLLFFGLLMAADVSGGPSGVTFFIVERHSQ